MKRLILGGLVCLSLLLSFENCDVPFIPININPGKNLNSLFSFSAAGTGTTYFTNNSDPHFVSTIYFADFVP